MSELDNKGDWKALQAWAVEQGMLPMTPANEATLPAGPWVDDGYGVSLAQEKATKHVTVWAVRLMFGKGLPAVSTIAYRAFQPTNRFDAYDLYARLRDGVNSIKPAGETK